MVALPPNKENGPLLMPLHRLGQTLPGRGSRDERESLRPGRTCPPWPHDGVAARTLDALYSTLLGCKIASTTAANGLSGGRMQGWQRGWAARGSTCRDANGNRLGQKWMARHLARSMMPRSPSCITGCTRYMARHCMCRDTLSSEGRSVWVISSDTEPSPTSLALVYPSVSVRSSR